MTHICVINAAFLKRELCHPTVCCFQSVGWWWWGWGGTGPQSFLMKVQGRLRKRQTCHLRAGLNSSSAYPLLSECKLSFRTTCPANARRFRLESQQFVSARVCMLVLTPDYRSISPIITSKDENLRRTWAEHLSEGILLTGVTGGAAIFFFFFFFSSLRLSGTLRVLFLLWWCQRCGFRTPIQACCCVVHALL